MGAVPMPAPSIPEDTFRAARRIYNEHNGYLQIGNHLDQVLASADMSLLNPAGRMTYETALRLALVTSFQYGEVLPDQIASEATMRRMDWKYALRLPAQHPGLSPALMCGFRHDLFPRADCVQAYGGFLAHLVRLGLPVQSEVETYEPLAALTLVCDLTRLYLLNQAMKSVLGVLGSVQPDWLRGVMKPHWYERYKTGRLSQIVYSGVADLSAEAVAIGTDSFFLLSAVDGSRIAELTDMPEVASMREIWREQFQHDQGEVVWRQASCARCSSFSRM